MNKKNKKNNQYINDLFILLSGLTLYHLLYMKNRGLQYILQKTNVMNQKYHSWKYAKTGRYRQISIQIFYTWISKIRKSNIINM